MNVRESNTTVELLSGQTIDAGRIEIQTHIESDTPDADSAKAKQDGDDDGKKLRREPPGTEKVVETGAYAGVCSAG